MARAVTRDNGYDGQIYTNLASHYATVPPVAGHSVLRDFGMVDWRCADPVLCHDVEFTVFAQLPRSKCALHAPHGVLSVQRHCDVSVKAEVVMMSKSQLHLDFIISSVESRAPALRATLTGLGVDCPAWMLKHRPSHAIARLHGPQSLLFHIQFTPRLPIEGPPRKL